MRTFFVLILIFFSVATFGQSSRKKKQRPKADEKSLPAPTTLDPNVKQEFREPPKKKKSKGPTYESEQHYYERMASLEKERRKNERMLDKPQYSDPAYFGHKRPPKRRPPHKMKFCKVCGIRH
jgi:hypothetical protein